MGEIDKTKNLVLKYFHSWQEPPNFANLRSCLSDEVIFDSGGSTIVGGDKLRQVIEATESPWKEVKLLASMFNINQGFPVL